MHDSLFADQKQLAVADLKRRAVEIGINGSRFDQCLDSGRYAAKVQPVSRRGRPTVVADDSGKIRTSSHDELLKKMILFTGVCRACHRGHYEGRHVLYKVLSTAACRRFH